MNRMTIMRPISTNIANIKIEETIPKRDRREIPLKVGNSQVLIIKMLNPIIRSGIRWIKLSNLKLKTINDKKHPVIGVGTPKKNLLWVETITL